jgi:DNA-binding transcriptional MerR regulator
MATVEQLEEGRIIRELQEHLPLSIGQCRKILKSCNRDSNRALALVKLFKHYFSENELVTQNENFNEKLKLLGLS